MKPIKSVLTARFYDVGSPDVVAIHQKTLHNYPFAITNDKGQGLYNSERQGIVEARTKSVR